ncbi:MAG: hypothetical protein FWC77_01295 [Defluviitaleaceae bacterium]|nr:hypothetical protein [Defluviitaleaceae bacterium]
MKNQLVMFLVGLAMLAAGLFWLTSIVHVTVGWGAGLRIGGATIPSGMTLVPLIAGILWVFFDPKSIGAKILLAIGVVVLITSILMTIRFQMPRTSLFEFIMIFIGIAGGAGLVSRVLFVKCTKS